MKFFYLFLVGMGFLMQSFAFANTELLKRAHMGQIAEVRRLLDAGADVNYVERMLTPLHIAIDGVYEGYISIRRGNIGIIDLLLDRGASTNTVDSKGFTPLRKIYPKRSFDSRSGRLDDSTIRYIARSLIDRGANVNDGDSSGYTPLHLAAYSRVERASIQLLLDRGANVNAAANDGQTPLHAAVASYNSIEIIQLLLDRGATINVAATNGRTPRDLAVSQGPSGVAIVQLLDRVTAEREAARIAAQQAAAAQIAAQQAAAARIAQANRVSLDPQVVSAQADLDAAAALEAYRIAAEASIAAQAAAAQEPTNTQRAQARDATARAALEAQTRSAQASLYAQTRRDLAQRAILQTQHEETIKQLKADHLVEIKGLKTMVSILCFPGETPINVKNPDSPEGYRSQPISSIHLGDSVVSCNLEVEGGACEFAQVKEVMKNTTDHLIQLSFDGRTLRATDNHPFYVVNKKEWVEAQYLRRGDQLRDISGETVTLKEVQGESGRFTVYNLEVETHHNYFAADVLVHNCNKIGVPVPPGI